MASEDTSAWGPAQCIGHYPVGRVAWPTGAPDQNEAHASTYVCRCPSVQDAAVRWVREVTGHLGVFVPFESLSVPGSSGEVQGNG